MTPRCSRSVVNTTAVATSSKVGISESARRPPSEIGGIGNKKTSVIIYLITPTRASSIPVINGNRTKRIHRCVTILLAMCLASAETSVRGVGAKISSRHTMLPGSCLWARVEGSLPCCLARSSPGSVTTADATR